MSNPIFIGIMAFMILATPYMLYRQWIKYDVDYNDKMGFTVVLSFWWVIYVFWFLIGCGVLK